MALNGAARKDFTLFFSNKRALAYAADRRLPS
jgi:hypothetical protein